MKKCPFCAEEIREEAVKCRFCGEFLIHPKSREPWYFKTPFLILGFLCVGPLILPLLWWNPRFSRKSKWILTLGAFLLTYLLALAAIESTKTLKDYYDQIFQILHSS